MTDPTTYAPTSAKLKNERACEDRDHARAALLVEIRSAREQGASWVEIAQAMGTGEATPRVMVRRAAR